MLGQLQHAVAAGATISELLAADHAGRDDLVTTVIDTARRRGQLLITPLHFAGRRGHVHDLPSLFVIGIGTDKAPHVGDQRRAAAKLCERLRLLDDPTRLLLLTLICSRGRRTAGDLARIVGLSAPSVSVHLRQLREAGLVAVTPDGPRTLYRGQPGAIEALTRTISNELLDLCRFDTPGGAARGGGARESSRRGRNLNGCVPA